MKIKYIILFLTCLLLLSSFTAPATACCEPPAPPCHHCEDTVWVNDCDSADCESCVDGSCEVCSGDPNKICCDGTCCDTDECEDCVDGSCQICGGDPDRICCPDGSCAWPCDEDLFYNICPTSKNVDCVSCYNTPWRCNDDKKYVFTGNPRYECWYGCPGDCHEVEETTHCYTEYKCADDTDFLAICDWVQVAPDEWDWKCVGPAPWDCYDCIRDPTDYGRKFYVSNKKCE